MFRVSAACVAEGVATLLRRVPLCGAAVADWCAYLAQGLGINHEQKRADGSQEYYGKGPHLEMFWENSGDKWSSQYTPSIKSYIGSADDGNNDPQVGYAEYDFESIMHYFRQRSSDRTINDGYYFNTIPSSAKNLVGNRKQLSALDIKQALDMYRCRTTTTTTTPVALHSPLLETGAISVSGQGDWQSFSFAAAFAEPPVVIAMSTGLGESQDVKIRSVTTTGFQALLVVPPPGTGNLPPVTAYYVAAQPGVHTLPDGRVFEAGQVETMSMQFQTQSCKPAGGVQRWDTVQFQGSFTSPVVVTKLQTANNENGTPPNGPSTPWLTPAVDSVSSSSFLVALDSGETEVSYIAVPPGVHTLPDGRIFEAGTKEVKTVQLGPLWDGSVWFISWFNFCLAKLCDQQLIRWLIRARPRYYSSSACVPTSGRRQWTTFFFQNTFTKAVVVAKLQTANNEQGTGGASQPWLVTAMKGVATTKFLLTLETGETQVGSVGQTETVGYIAMEEGRLQLQQRNAAVHRVTDVHG
eukprot:Skav225724  [mRNA]  locus=scaffold611:27549:37574:+ [translate_table: standard]